MNTTMKILAASAMMAATVAFAADEAETTFAAGFSGENSSCGDLLPSAWGDYDRDSDDVAAHAYVKVSPGGGCTGSIAIDTEVSKRLPLGTDGLFVSGIVGFDQHTQTYELENMLTGVKSFQSQTEQAATAAFGVGRDFGDWRIEAGMNVAAEYDGAIEPGYVQFSGNFEKWELDVTLSEPVSTLDLEVGKGTTLRLVSRARELGAYAGPHALVAPPPWLEIAIEVPVFRR